MANKKRFSKVNTAGKLVPKSAKHWDAVVDNTTGLMWAVKPIKVSSQRDAEAAIKGLKVAGAKGWRVSTVEEVFLLCDRTRHNPAIDIEAFPELKDITWLWTSTPAAYSPVDYAWDVLLSGGSASWGGRCDSGFFLAVRASQ